jgi:hypothetical protein
MAAILDMAKFTFDGETIQAVSELVFDEVIKAPEINAIHTIYNNIVTDKEIGFVGEGGLVGVKNQGCEPEPQDWAIATRLLKWEPADWEILIHSCWTDLKSTAATYSTKTGTAVADFTNSDYMNIVVEVLTTAMKKFFIRLIWFSDKNAENVNIVSNANTGGIITAGVPIKYFNIIDGFWKQIMAKVAANPKQRVILAENNSSTYAAQALAPANVQQYLQKLIFGAPILLRQQTGLIICTQSFYDAYAISLQGVNLESMFSNLIEGVKTLTYNGVPLFPMPIWDEMIGAFENIGAKLNNPHRALYTTKSILGVGVDDESSFGNIDIWYDRDSRKVKMEGMGIADAKLINPDLFAVAI